MKQNSALVLGLLLLLGLLSVVPWVETSEAQGPSLQPIRVHVVDTVGSDVAGADVWIRNEDSSEVGFHLAGPFTTNAQGVVQMNDATEVFANGGLDADVGDTMMVYAKKGTDEASSVTITVQTAFPLIDVELAWNEPPECDDGGGNCIEGDQGATNDQTTPYVFVETDAGAGAITWSVIGGAGSVTDPDVPTLNYGTWTDYGEIVWFESGTGNPDFDPENAPNTFGHPENQIFATYNLDDENHPGGNVEADIIDTATNAAGRTGLTWGSSNSIPGIYTISMVVWDETFFPAGDITDSRFELTESVVYTDDTDPVITLGSSTLPLSVPSTTTWQVIVYASDPDGGTVSGVDFILTGDTTESTPGAGDQLYCPTASDPCTVALTNDPSGSAYWRHTFIAPTRAGHVDWSIDIADTARPVGYGDVINTATNIHSDTTYFTMAGGSGPDAVLQAEANADPAPPPGANLVSVTIDEGEWIAFDSWNTLDGNPGVLTSGANWQLGDFNHDVVVDFGDGSATCRERGDLYPVLPADGGAESYGGSPLPNDGTELSTCQGTDAPFSGTEADNEADGIFGHSYTNKGTYVATITVTDYEGYTDADPILVIVQDTTAPAAPSTFKWLEGNSPWTGADVTGTNFETGGTYTFVIENWYDVGTPVEPVVNVHYYHNGADQGTMTSMGAGSGSYYYTITIPTDDETDFFYAVTGDDSVPNTFSNVGTPWTKTVVDGTNPFVDTFQPTTVVSPNTGFEMETDVGDLVATFDVLPIPAMTVFIDYDISGGDGLLACGGVAGGPAGTDQIYYLDIGAYIPNPAAANVIIGDVDVTEDACNDWNGAVVQPNDYPYWQYTVAGFYTIGITVEDDAGNTYYTSYAVTAGSLGDYMTVVDGWNVIPMKFQDFEWCNPAQTDCTFLPTAENLVDLYPEVEAVGKWSPAEWDWEWVWVVGSDNEQNFFMSSDYSSGYGTVNGVDLSLPADRIPQSMESFAVFVDLGGGGSINPAGSDDIFADSDGVATAGSGDPNQASGAVAQEMCDYMGAGPDLKGADQNCQTPALPRMWAWYDENTDGDYDWEEAIFNSGVDSTFGTNAVPGDDELYVDTPNAPCDPDGVDPDCHRMNEAPNGAWWYLDDNADGFFSAGEDIYQAPTTDAIDPWVVGINLYMEGSPYGTTFDTLRADDGLGEDGAGFNAISLGVDTAFAGVVPVGEWLSHMGHPLDDGSTTAAMNTGTAQGVPGGAGTPGDGIVDAWAYYEYAYTGHASTDYYTYEIWDATNQVWRTPVYTEVQSADGHDMIPFDDGGMLHIGEVVYDDAYRWSYEFDMSDTGPSERDNQVLNTKPDIYDIGMASGIADIYDKDTSLWAGGPVGTLDLVGDPSHDIRIHTIYEDVDDDAPTQMQIIVLDPSFTDRTGGVQRTMVPCSDGIHGPCDGGYAGAIYNNMPAVGSWADGEAFIYDPGAAGLFTIDMVGTWQFNLYYDDGSGHVMDTYLLSVSDSGVPASPEIKIKVINLLDGNGYWYCDEGGWSCSGTPTFETGGVDDTTKPEDYGSATYLEVNFAWTGFPATSQNFGIQVWDTVSGWITNYYTPDYGSGNAVAGDGLLEFDAGLEGSDWTSGQIVVRVFWVESPTTYDEDEGQSAAGA